MKVLVLCDDRFHPGHIVENGIAKLKEKKEKKEKGFSFDVMQDMNDFETGGLKNYGAVLLSKSGNMSSSDETNWKTKETMKAFVDYVEGGGGLLVTHSGVVPGKNSDTLDNLIGCRFISHPQQCPVTVQPIKKHPVTNGVGMFIETDEHYRIDIIAADTDIIMASYMPQQGSAEYFSDNPYTNTPAYISASGYVRTQGRGRVCVLTPGHCLSVWHNAEYQKALENALNWCGGR
ncbi:MAG: ThuA domain-containing protein [Defluviitaleaceae bacterium]|nr:ThuA domain-containing protein [Defluviitaleaceae bacterium]